MIIKRTKIVECGRANILMKQIVSNIKANTKANTKANIKTKMKNKNILSEENNHACF
jgi:hypothetical protein